MNPATWEALNGLPLRYTTTLRRFYLLHPTRALKAPCLTYSVRTPARAGASWATSAARPRPGSGSAR